MKLLEKFTLPATPGKNGLKRQIRINLSTLKLLNLFRMLIPYNYRFGNEIVIIILKINV